MRPAPRACGHENRASAIAVDQRLREILATGIQRQDGKYSDAEIIGHVIKPGIAGVRLFQIDESYRAIRRAAQVAQMSAAMGRASRVEGRQGGTGFGQQCRTPEFAFLLKKLVQGCAYVTGNEVLAQAKIHHHRHPKPGCPQTTHSGDLVRGQIRGFPFGEANPRLLTRFSQNRPEGVSSGATRGPAGSAIACATKASSPGSGAAPIP
jgi:hypothetical protein